MSYQIERLSNLPALFLSFSDNVDFAAIMEEMSEAVFISLEAAERPIYYLIDGRNVKLSFNDILNAVQLGTKRGHSNFKHRNIKQMIFISESKAIATVVRGLNTVSFGNINALIFESPEIALSYVRLNAA